MQGTRQKINGTTSASVQPFRESALVTDNNFLQELLPVIKSAKRSIDVCSYSWRWYSLEPELALQQFNTLLLEKLRAGLFIRILCDDLTDYKTLIKLGFKVVVVGSEKTLHAKAILIDDDKLILGSHNLTKRGTLDNYETSIFTSDPNLIIQFINYYNKLWRLYG